MKDNIGKSVLRYIISTFGIFLVAFGIVLSVNANLGINGLNATPYAFSVKYPIFTLGLYNILFFTVCMLVQLLVLGRRFKWIDLLQVPANFLLGIFINWCAPLCLSLGLVLPAGPEAEICAASTEVLGENLAAGAASGSSSTVLIQIGLLVLACIISAIGISLEVSAKAWMLPADMTVRAFAIATKGKFSTVKIFVDCSILLISLIVCLLFFGNLLGPKETPIIGWGTLALAVCIGLCMKLTQPLTDRLCSKLQ